MEFGLVECCFWLMELALSWWIFCWLFFPPFEERSFFPHLANDTRTKNSEDCDPEPKRPFDWRSTLSQLPSDDILDPENCANFRSQPNPAKRLTLHWDKDVKTPHEFRRNGASWVMFRHFFGISRDFWAENIEFV